MNRQEYIDKYVGDIDIGDIVEFTKPPREYKPPVIGTIRDIFRVHSIGFTIDCEDADGKRFEYYNASLESIKRLKMSILVPH